MEDNLAETFTSVVSFKVRLIRQNSTRQTCELLVNFLSSMTLSMNVGLNKWEGEKERIQRGRGREGREEICESGRGERDEMRYNIE